MCHCESRSGGVVIYDLKYKLVVLGGKYIKISGVCGQLYVGRI